MKKITKAATIFILAVSFTAYTANKTLGGEHDYISNQSDGTSEPSSVISSDKPDRENPLPFTLFGADNVQINFEEVTTILDRSGKPV